MPLGIARATPYIQHRAKEFVCVILWQSWRLQEVRVFGGGSATHSSSPEESSFTPDPAHYDMSRNPSYPCSSSSEPWFATTNITIGIRLRQHTEPHVNMKVTTDVTIIELSYADDGPWNERVEKLYKQITDLVKHISEDAIRARCNSRSTADRSTANAQ
ncbi:hypothetical protein L210DRAFT_3499678 [Boletus edulis BED1]|uniref:Uncharacterized protein n=1 Tax=Boletus edulis BED1 TaxID=1328754 RepID=A0AAD4C9B9_BOLED|nr:hypothetical protein L210DRAFT_3499678 [Boletus edulis BED1]